MYVSAFHILSLSLCLNPNHSSSSPSLSHSHPHMVMPVLAKFVGWLVCDRLCAIGRPAKVLLHVLFAEDEPRRTS